MLKSFENLLVYQKSRVLTKEIYLITKSFPDDEKFGVTVQIRRAAVSICCNLAEGSGKTSKKDQIRFIEIGYGSLMEVLNLIILSKDLEYISISQAQELNSIINEIAMMLSGLRRTYQKSS